METEELARRLAAFDAAVSDGPYPDPPAGEWSAETILAHAAMVNRLVALSVASAIDGQPVAYSNRLAGSERLLRAVVAASGGVRELKSEVIRTGRILIDLAGHLGSSDGSSVQTLIAEGEVVHVDGPVPAYALIASTLGYHLGIHREQLAALGVEPSSSRAAVTPTSSRAAPAVAA